MKYWPNQVFSFLLSITKVNINLAATYFGGQELMGQINFRKKLAKTLIFNTHYNEDDEKTPEKKQKQQEYGHCLITLPKSKTFSDTQIITANSQYPQRKCITCKKGTYLLPMLPRSLPVFLACTKNNLSTWINNFQTKIISVTTLESF